MSDDRIHRLTMPRWGLTMTEGKVVKWLFREGAEITVGAEVVEVETEKIVSAAEAPIGGLLRRQVAKEGQVVPVSGLLGIIAGPEVSDDEIDRFVQTAGPILAPEEATGPAPERVQPAGRSTRDPGQVSSTPGARRRAAKLGIDIGQVTPTGRRGKVTEADVRAHAEQGQGEAGPALPPGLPPPSRTVAIEGMRRSIADHMRGSLAGTAQLSFSLELDVTEAQRLRKEASQGAGTVIAMAHVLIKACAESLGRNPELNSVMSDGHILYFDQVNIGVAVALKEGLIVPVVRRADAKSVSEIAAKTTELVARARDGKLVPDDMVGGTFTISVLGVVDVFTPILNAGQSAILGVGRSVDRTVVKDGQVAVRETMTVSLTVDHQVIDGAVAAGFLRRLKQIVERPAALFK